MTQKNSIAKIAHQNSEGNAPSSITSKEAPLSPEMLSQWKDKSATAEDSSDQQPHQEKVLDTTENSKKRHWPRNLCISAWKSIKAITQIWESGNSTNLQDVP